MSLPTFPNMPDDFTFDKSIYQIITSIAMEEIGLSHIINAEGEKIQYVLGTLEGVCPPAPPTIEEILAVNKSVRDTLQQVAFNQMFLSSKMSAALDAYAENKKEENGGGDDPLPTTLPCVIDAIVLPPRLTGDIVDWIAIASYEGYYLIVRTHYININEGHTDDPSFQFVPYGSTNNYTYSSVRSFINKWFSGPAPGTADSLPLDAVMRNFTMQNNALTVLGSGSSLTGGLTNGFSIPTNVQISSGASDVAFALSFCEAANFISKTYSTTGSGITAPSNLTASQNFDLITIPSHLGQFYNMWHRSPGVNTSTAGTLSITGRAFQSPLASDDDPGLIYPALWVKGDILKGRSG